MSASSTYDRAASDARKPLAVPRDGSLDARECVRMGVLAASSHNTQPWRFRLGSGIEVLPDFSRRCPVVDPDDAHLYKSLGCAAENVAQAAARMGFASSVQYDPALDRVRIAFSRGTQASGLADAIPVRQCTKLPYDARPVAPRLIGQLERAGTGHRVRTLLLTGRTQMDAIADFVASGNRLQLNDPAFRRELVKWIRFNPASAIATGDGLSGRVTGQPALPDWLAPALVSFVLKAESQAALDTRNILSSSGVAVTVATGDGPEAWVEAGRAWQRFALQAAALDIRTAFINQPIEARSLLPQLTSWLGLDGEQPMLMVRFGYGPLAPFSLRRPPSEVIDTAEGVGPPSRNEQGAYHG
jgi:hypothetical protein